MKKLFVLFWSLLISGLSFAGSPINVNEQVIRLFKENFPDAVQVLWVEFPNTYVVSFVEDGIRSRITYGKDGSFIGSYRYYNERTLPYYLLSNLKKKYPHKTIFGITEIASDSDIAYFVKMEDSKVWITLRMDTDGNLNVVEKYEKAK